MPTSSRAARITLYVVLAFVILAGGASAFAQWRAGTADKDRQTATERSDEISRCVGGYRVRYVDAPAERSREAERRVLVLVAKGQIETDTYREAVRDFASIETDVDEFEKVNRRARLHPDAFLRDCRRENP